MKISIDENNVITAIVYNGNIPDGIEVPCVPVGVGVLTHKYVNGKFIANPDYTPPEPAPAPAVTMEQRMSATEDAVAEIIEMLMGGESDG